MKKYFVIATVWSSAENKQVDTIVGEFNKFHNANIFKEAYNDYYSATAYIKETAELLNA